MASWPTGALWAGFCQLDAFLFSLQCIWVWVVAFLFVLLVVDFHLVFMVTLLATFKDSEGFM